MEIIFTHNLGEGITKFVDETLLSKLDFNESNREYEIDEAEGLIDITEHIGRDEFEGGKELVLQHIKSLGYEEDDESWENEAYLKIIYTLDWDNEKISIKYNFITFYLLSETGQTEWSIPNNFTYYVEKVFKELGFAFKEKVIY